MLLDPIQGQSVVASRSKTSKQNQTPVVATAVSETVSSVATAVSKTVSSISSVVVGLGLSLPLGNMDDSGGVGDVASGTGVTSSDGGDGGTSKAGDVHGGGG